MKKQLTICYLLAIALLAIPVQGLMAGGCELPLIETQQTSIAVQTFDHSQNHSETEPSLDQTEQHACCDEATCPDMDNYCGSCMNLLSLTGENFIYPSLVESESHLASTTVFIDLAPPPPTKPPV